MKQLIALLPVVALSVASLSAQDAGQKKSPEKIFAKADKNGDGKLTVEEFTADAKKPKKAAARFAKLDANGDGSLTLEEVRAGLSAKKESKGDDKAGE